MSRLIFDAATLGGTTTLSSEDAVGNFTIDVPAKTGTLLIPATVGLAGQALVSNATTAPTWQYLPGVGTVISVNVSGGTTGLTTSGGPVTGSGVITLAGTLAVANGGTGVTALGTGVVAALGVNVGTAGAPVVNGGALGTPSSGTVTNLTGTASININGTVGASTPTTGAFTTLAASSTVSGTGFTSYFALPPALGTTAPAEVKATVGWAANTALTDAATVAWDTNNQVATFTFVSSNRTMGAPTNLKNGAFYALAVIQNAGSNTLTWNSVFKWAAGVAPTLSTAAGAKDYFTFRSDGTNLYQQGISQAVA